jgi:phospholipase C
MISGTSGGITSNGICCLGILDSGRWPIILDLLEEAGVTWKIYNLIGIDDILTGETDNTAVFWSRWGHDPRTFATQQDYLQDCVAGTLPAVSWVIGSSRDELDEHAPADVSIGMRRQQQLIEALRASPLYPRSAFLLTYDEHGGFLDHVPPPRLDAFGLGFRVPLWVISPLLRRRGVVATRRPGEHVSTLKLVERLHGLPTLASRNHAFDHATPIGPGHDANGAPAPPRDGLSAISDLTDLFALDRGLTGAGVQSSRNRGESA